MDAGPVSSTIAEFRRDLRAALARELHDGPIQSLTESVIKLERYRSAAQSREMQAAISDVEESVRIALMSLRHLIGELRDEPPAEDLAVGIGAMAARYQAASGIDISVVVSPEWPARLPSHVALNLVRIVQEAITNATRHAGAAQVLVELQTVDELLLLTVSDDGQGMAPDTPPGSGLIGMSERAALLGGRFAIRARRPGTQIRVEIPRP